MKKLFCFAIYILISSSAVFSQEIDKYPEFPGGLEQMSLFIIEHIQYPEDAVNYGDQGKVYVEFVVEKNGSISNIKVVKGVVHSLDEEATRVVSLMPNWSPGMLDGEPVRVQYTVPISFRLEDLEPVKGKNDSK